MKTFQPQVQLTKRIHLDAPDEYFLHSVTFCDRTCYTSRGNEPIPQVLNENGVFQITLKITQSEEIPDLPFLTPIIHTFRLGNIPSNEEALIQVDLMMETTDNNRPAGSVTISSTSASEDDRPIASFIGNY